MHLSGCFVFNNSVHALVIIIIFSASAYATPSPSPYRNFESCVPQSCGRGPNISYPFWIAGQQESYCGHPNFDVNCTDQNPVVKISDDYYIIKDIFYANNSFLLASSKACDFNITCPIPLHNFSTDGTPFDYSPSCAHLYFFYDCESDYSDATYQVSCGSNATHYSFADFHIEILKHNNYSIESCKSWVRAPAEAEDISILLEMNFTDVLRKGFVLQWNESNCSDCETSGGHCGSAGDDFICFCPDGPCSRTCGEAKSKWKIKLGIGIAASVGTLLVVGVAFWIHRLRRKRKPATSWASRNTSSYTSSMTDLEKASTCYGVQVFSFEELEVATDNFDSKQELGDGGYGTVYRGKLRDGRTVAVKRLYGHNYRRLEQFMNEVDILAHLRHRNLVTLYGCTSRHCRDLLLVYEYIPNGTVADHLHGESAKPGSLSWATRMSIAIQTASALTYLHASDVIHRDVKTNNILLDDNFCVKVADFGLSRLFPNDASHVSTAPQGTPGYVDPEYHECYQLTAKSDVYSFGVVLIELISSKPAVDITRHRHEINLSNMAVNKIQNRKLHELVDPALGFESDFRVRTMITAVAELAFQCLQNGRDMRPSMEEVLLALKEIPSEDDDVVKAEEVVVPADDIVLLQSDQLVLSPVSVMENWNSKETTPNASS